IRETRIKVKGQSVALVITTYNWPEALAAVLRSVKRQARLPDEVVVADDGSGPETAGAVGEALEGSGLVWLHVRHEDRGIRQARIKNLAVRHTGAEYLIFVDHDVVLHPCFVEEHLSMAGRGVFLQGKRSFLPEPLSERILKGEAFSMPGPLTPGLGNRKNAFRSPVLGRLLSGGRRFQTSLRGCNLSMTREDFLLVDGYDETFDAAWGREDSDICYRLFHSGVSCRNLWFMALQYHLDHAVQKNRARDGLDEELDRLRQERRGRALRGFSALSGEGGVVRSDSGRGKGSA
ncbi:MAG: glycosyltransferase, partial [Desulfatiglandales bacterium]